MTKLLNRAFKVQKKSKLRKNSLNTATKIKPRNKNRLTKNGKRIWGVQVGAFYNRKPALALAKTISKRYAKTLKGGHIKVMPLLKSRNRVLYRARIIGIGQRNAHRTCKILKKYRKPCLAINLHPSTEVASR